MDPFILIELTLILAPPLGLLVVRGIDTGHRTRIGMAAVAAVALVAVLRLLGLTLAPPLQFVMAALGVIAIWMALWILRSAHRRLGGAVLIPALMAEYFTATVGVLGLGFGVLAAQPEVRQRLSPSLVVNAYRVGGPSVDVSGYLVQVRRTVPLLGFVERIAKRESYVRPGAGRLTPPSFGLPRDADASAVLVYLGDWWWEVPHTGPDTIPLN